MKKIANNKKNQQPKRTRLEINKNRTNKLSRILLEIRNLYHFLLISNIPIPFRL